MQDGLRERQSAKQLRLQQKNLSAAARIQNKEPKPSTNNNKNNNTPLGSSPIQELLNTIREACADTFAAEDFDERLQDMKKEFFNRNFDDVFGKKENLPVYTAQYVPSRVLAYYTLFLEEPEICSTLTDPNCSAVCLGAGAGSELISILAASLQIPPSLPLPETPTTSSGRSLTVLDYADWSSVHEKLLSVVRSRWNIPTSASDVARGWNVDFALCDALRLEDGMLEQHVSKASLITAMFVLNELMTTSRAKTMKLIVMLGRAMKKGSKLLVVDSAGSFSNLQVNSSTYFLYNILDHIKLFRVVVADDSRWYRLPKERNYPLECQNMRYFVRLYERI